MTGCVRFDDEVGARWWLALIRGVQRVNSWLIYRAGVRQGRAERTEHSPPALHSLGTMVLQFDKTFVYL